ncbi:MAG: anaerobic ribonucleoside-triphosphate reductase activating protein [Hydrogenimonas sp.]|nr:anaerobic ribonucleoside-triphosphate reductase activating protein [Hydrogenimonas sp.]
MSDKPIYDITPFTHLDYPGKLACIVWFRGCNMRCMYCYNSDIVFAKSGNYTENDLYAFLKKRVGLLDGVVLSGGEPTTHELLSICTEIRRMGFSIKLDTNGLNRESVEDLVEKGLVDFISLDFKAMNGKFGYITGSSRFSNFFDTLKFLVSSGCDFEVRTTVHADLLEPKDINDMMRLLYSVGYRGTYYLQEFIETRNNIANIEKPKKEFDKSLLEDTLSVVWR